MNIGLSGHRVPVVLLFALSYAAAQGDPQPDLTMYENTPAPAPGSCPKGVMNATLEPEVTQGPYYLAEKLLRSNITEGQQGVALDFRLTVLDTTCKPVVGTFVDVWHCNATGSYSSYTGLNPGGTIAPAPSRKLLQAFHETPTDNTTFMRGTVQTDENGVALVHTIVPGWYSDRVTHIHAVVHIPDIVSENATAEYEDSHIAHSAQFYFPDDVLTPIFHLYPYSRHTGLNRTYLDKDLQWVSGGSRREQIMTIDYKQPGNVGAGLVGSVTAVIQPSANHPGSIMLSWPPGQTIPPGFAMPHDPNPPSSSMPVVTTTGK